MTIRSALFLDRKPAQGLGIDPVAFLDAMGDVVFDVGGSGQPKARPQDAGAAHAVDVVVAVNDDLAVIPDRPDDSLGGLDRTGQQLGVVQISQPGLEKRPRPAGSSMPRLSKSCATRGEMPAPRLRLWMPAGSWGLIRQRAFIEGDVLGWGETRGQMFKTISFAARSIQIKQGDIAMIAFDPQKSKPLGNGVVNASVSREEIHAEETRR